MATSIWQVGTTIGYEKTTSGTGDNDIYWPGGGTSVAETPLIKIIGIKVVVTAGTPSGTYSVQLRDGGDTYFYLAYVDSGNRLEVSDAFPDGGINVHGLLFKNSVISAGVDILVYTG